MHSEILHLIKDALNSIGWGDYSESSYTVEFTKNRLHGDYTCNIAMIIVKNINLELEDKKLTPRDIATKIVAAIDENDFIKKIEVAGPGFINFFLDTPYYAKVISSFLATDQIQFDNIGAGRKVLLEYVSTNPTGPIHVGHGRSAAFGSALASLLKATGYKVYSEYYLNDAGTQIKILCLSVFLRYLQRFSVVINYPAKCYQGDYINEIADKFITINSSSLYDSCSAKLENIFVCNHNDEDLELKNAISSMIKILSKHNYSMIYDFVLLEIKSGISSDLSDFGVNYDNWFSEVSLHESGAIDAVFDKLLDNGYIYSEEGAYWFTATKWGDEKDRVIKRESGEYTYFAADLAYHWQKFELGYDNIIDIFGADHHGYIPRLTAGLSALSCDITKFKVLLVQFATLSKNGVNISMSTRSGKFVTLSDLVSEVGIDASRFFYLNNKPQNHMEFDLELAKKNSTENPVYYVQYANARISAIMRNIKEKGADIDNISSSINYKLLSTKHEQALMFLISIYRYTVVNSSKNMAPFQVANFLYDLAAEFHSYYNNVKFIIDDSELMAARCVLISVVAKILRSGLDLLGVGHPDIM